MLRSTPIQHINCTWCKENNPYLYRLFFLRRVFSRPIPIRTLAFWTYTRLVFRVAWNPFVFTSLANPSPDCDFLFCHTWKYTPQAVEPLLGQAARLDLDHGVEELYSLTSLGKLLRLKTGFFHLIRICPKPGDPILGGIIWIDWISDRLVAAISRNWSGLTVSKYTGSKAMSCALEKLDTPVLCLVRMIGITAKKVALVGCWN